MRIPVIVYETVIMLMSLTALQLLAGEKSAVSAVIFAGSVLFLVSDSLLARFIFSVKPAWGDFVVMACYIAAQAAIVMGLAALPPPV
jgi:uncharacterized membrane protein YhhN